MVGILAQRTVGDTALSLRATTEEGPIALAPSWLLVVRARTWRRTWSGQVPTPCLGLHVVIFEDIAKAIGAARFDSTVAALVGDRFYETWIADERE
jgi:hypothetical protein